jgi:hypothetical protein
MKAADSTKVLVTCAVIACFIPPIIWGWLVFGGGFDSRSGSSSTTTVPPVSNFSSPPVKAPAPKPRPDKPEIRRIDKRVDSTLSQLDSSGVLEGYADYDLAQAADEGEAKAQAWLSENEGRSAAYTRYAKALSKFFRRISDLANSPSRYALDLVNRSIAQLNRLKRGFFGFF